MRKKDDGVSLASIVAKETSYSEGSGSVSGVGIGTGGLGLFTGVSSMSFTTQTQRAKEFEAPAPPSFNVFYVFGSIIVLIIMGMLFSCANSILEPMETLATRNTGLQTDVSNLSSYLGGFMLITIIIGVLFHIFQAPRKFKEAQETLNKDETKHKKLMEVYYRLRYVEADNIVFDPKTMLETIATEQNIYNLMESIIEGENIYNRVKSS